MMQKSKISSAKLEEVKRIKKLAKENRVIGLANLSKVPAKALHDLRNQLRGDVVITMSKKKLIEIAFKEILKRLRGSPKIKAMGLESVKRIMMLKKRYLGS